MKDKYNAQLTQQELADLAGYTVRGLQKIDSGLDAEHKIFVRAEGSRKYDLALFVQRWTDFQVSRHTNDELMDFGEIKTQHERVKKHKTELQVQQMEGELIPVRDVRRLWGDVIDTARKALLQVSNQVAPQLLMIDSVEKIANVIDERIREELEHIADTPLPGYVEGGDEE